MGDFMKTCAVCICAYDCAEFIPTLIKGIRNQYQAPGWRYEFRIGSDACEKTSAALRREKFPHFMAEKNVGHGVLRNALIYAAPADAYAYFDADDVMMPAYLKRNLSVLKNNRIVMAAKYNTDVNLKIRNGPVVQNGGAMTIPHRVIEYLGGFQHYRCAIDTDLMDRAKMAGFVIYPIKEGLYYRRAHAKALTRRSDTGMGSAYRKKAWAEMTADRKRGIIKIDPVLVKLREVKRDDF
jgi:glycosyltransferase involved in cell wall biosynthesis